MGAVELDKHPKAKTLIYPVDVADADTQDTHRMYVRSHQDYAPGEQRTRNYDWEASGVNPKTTVFGQTEKNPLRNGVALALHPGVATDGFNREPIVSKLYETNRLTEVERLGEVKKLGHGRDALTDEHVYGVPSRRFAEWGARRLMTGIYTEEEQQPDADLGKSIKPGFRNVSTFPERTYGTPTIRTDIPSPVVKGVADDQNYGDEPDAMALLYPSADAERGVTDRDFLMQRPKDEVKEIMAAAGALGNVDEELFENIFAHAAALDGKSEDTCSIVAFKECKRQMLAERF